MSDAATIFRITTEIEFAYGHRLLDYDGKCAHPHGHNARVEIELAGTSLDQADMLVDFTVLKHTLGAWVNEHIDHKMVLRQDDPLVAALQALDEPVFLMEHNPTAESLAQLLYNVAAEHALPVRRVRFWESPTSSAEYAPEPARASPSERPAAGPQGPEPALSLPKGRVRAGTGRIASTKTRDGEEKGS